MYFWFMFITGFTTILLWYFTLFYLLGFDKYPDKERTNIISEVAIYATLVPLGGLFLWMPALIFTFLGAYIAFCTLLRYRDKRLQLHFSLARLCLCVLLLSGVSGFTVYMSEPANARAWGLR